VLAELIVRSAEPMNKDKDDSDMLPNYDFSNGEQGKYSQMALKSSHVVLLDSDVVNVFPTSEAVNEALRGLIPVSSREADRTQRP
jgi:hypothetical protein